MNQCHGDALYKVYFYNTLHLISLVLNKNTLRTYVYIQRSPLYSIITITAVLCILVFLKHRKPLVE